MAVNDATAAIVGAVVIVALCAGCIFLGVKYADAGWQKRWDLAQAAATQKLEQQRAAMQATIDDVNAKRAQDGQAYRLQVDSANRNYWGAIRMLRDSESARAKLQAAAAAPPQCGGYAAPPTQLSIADAAMALGIAKAGDDAIRQLGLCQHEYSGAVTEYNALIAKLNASK